MELAILVVLAAFYVVMGVAFYIQKWQAYNKWYDYGVEDRTDNWYWPRITTSPRSIRNGYNDGYAGIPRKVSWLYNKIKGGK